MVAVDTNVLIRLLTDDDPGQAASARALFATEAIWVAKTVLLETTWVLRSVYGFDEDAIRASLLSLLGLSNVQAEEERQVFEALRLSGQGMELADSLHLCSRPAGSTFVSFDRALVRGAKRAGVVRTREV
jgi:predicted nucleic-acid-binding protein